MIVPERKPLLIGASLALLSGFLLLALASYSSADPSFSNTGAGATGNLLGAPGAYAADFLLQLFGITAWLLPLLAGGWSYCVLRGDLPSFAVARVVSLSLALPAFSGMMGLMEAPLAWPVNAGLGGYLGYVLYYKLEPVLTVWGYGPGVTVLALAGVLFASGVPVTRVVAAAETAWFLAQEAWNYLQWAADVVLRREREEEEDLDDTDEEEEDEEEIEEEEEEPKTRARKEKKKKKKEVDTKQESFVLVGGSNQKFQLPEVGLLKPAPRSKNTMSQQAMDNNAQLLEATLKDFGVSGEIKNVRPGPVVTLYELEPAPGTKSSRVIGLADDIARSMSAISARIAVVPGQNVMGVELPNQKRETVFMREILESDAYEDNDQSLPLALGKDIGGEPVVVDLAKMPHLLVAGTTGSGKSVAINTMILSLLYRLTPAQCRFIMIDPKMLELSVYDGIPHLLSPVVTEPGKAVVALKWAVKEMENRYRLMSNLSVRNVAGYNQKIKQAVQSGEQLTRKVQTGFDPETGKPVIEDVPLEMEPLPYIVVIVDEMADLMLVAGKDIETSIQRLAQMARAAGIHLIMATQRPSVDVITGVIKANFPTRISFQVTSRIDSRTILGEQGAEQLLGQGDMLYMAGGSRITRVHGGFVSDAEVEKVVAHLKAQGEPSYVTDVTEHEPAPGEEAFDFEEGEGGEEDLYRQAVAVVCRDGKASTSYVQRRLKIGYNRAASLIERMEEEGVISAPNHAGKREVLMGEEV